MTTGDDLSAEQLRALVESAGLEHLLPRYEESLRVAIEQAKRHAQALEGALQPSSEPAHTFKPEPPARRS